MPEPPKAIFVGGNGGLATGDEIERGKDLARRYRCEFVDLKNFHIQHELFRKIPVDLMFRYNFVPLEDKDGWPAADRHRRSQPADDDRRDRPAVGAPHLHQGRLALADQRHPEEDRAVAARAGRSQRRFRARRHRRGRELRRDHLHREADGRNRHQPHHPSGRYHDLHRVAAARQRYSHRDARRLGGHQVPHRRRAPAGHAAHRQGASFHHHLAHQGHERARHLRTSRAPGWPLPRALQRSLHRLPRLHHAVDPR